MTNEIANTENNSYIKRIVELTEFLSMDYESQCGKSPLPNDMIPDDLANDWEWVTGLAQKLYSNNKISLECFSIIKLINKRFNQVSLGEKSFDKSIWCESGFKSHPFWAEQRELATDLLIKLESIE